MMQIIITTDPDVRLELGIQPVGKVWIGTPWTEDERREYLEEKYRNEGFVLYCCTWILPRTTPAKKKRGR